jgi:3-oxoadipate enol-lactonase
MPLMPLADIEIYHELHGDPDGPPILVISGTGNDLRRSMPDRSPLNRAGRTCHYDQRGLGRTSKPPGPYTMVDYADDAARLIIGLGWESCHVVGTSFGGMVALNLVLRHPQLVDRLVLNCTSPGGPYPSFPLETLADLGVDERIDRSMQLSDSRYDPLAVEPIPDIPASVFSSWVENARTERTGDALTGYQNQLAARAGHDVDAHLGSIRSPTLVCAGRFDRTAPPANSQRLAERIPNARLEMFDGGHLFLIQDRRAYGAIVEFLAG